MKKAVFIILCLLSSNLQAEEEVELDSFSYHMQEPKNDTPTAKPTVRFMYTAEQM